MECEPPLLHSWLLVFLIALEGSREERKYLRHVKCKSGVLALFCDLGKVTSCKINKVISLSCFIIQRNWTNLKEWSLPSMSFLPVVNYCTWIDFPLSTILEEAWKLGNVSTLQKSGYVQISQLVIIWECNAGDIKYSSSTYVSPWCLIWF